MARSSVPLRWRAGIGLLRRLPQGALSRGAGRLADLPLPRALRRPVLGAFARLTGADPGEAEQPLAEYRSVDAFFTRRLRPGARTQDPDPLALTSPVDGFLGQLGRIADGRLLEVKGRTYSAAELLDGGDVSPFEGGLFLTFYLSPRHYHRIHAPCAGLVDRVRAIPGALLPVNPWSVVLVPGLFPRNERVVCHLASETAGPVVVVAVGATNVGRISVELDPEWNRPTGGVSNLRGGTSVSRSYEPPVTVARGDELMTFHLGSTVVVLTGPGRHRLLDTLAPGTEIRVGEAVARSG